MLVGRLIVVPLTMPETTQRLERVDGLAVPILAISRPTHHLKVQMRRVFRRVAGRADESERFADKDGATRNEAIVIVNNEGLLMHDPRVAADGVLQDPAEWARAHAEILSVVRR